MTSGMFAWHDLVGYAGSATVVVLYLLSVQGRVDTAGLRFPLANLCGCALIMVSLYYNFNPPSFAIEVFWSLVSLYGIVRTLRARWRRVPAQSPVVAPGGNSL